MDALISYGFLTTGVSGFVVFGWCLVDGITYAEPRLLDTSVADRLLVEVVRARYTARDVLVAASLIVSPAIASKEASS